MNPRDAKGLRRLTRSQFAVVALLYRDELDYPEAARRLNVRIRTIRMHVEYVARDLPGRGPPAWKVLRYAERLLEMGFRHDPPRNPDIMTRAS